MNTCKKQANKYLVTQKKTRVRKKELKAFTASSKWYASLKVREKKSKIKSEKKYRTDVEDQSQSIKDFMKKPILENYPLCIQMIHA